jgi:hypothetical protein
MLGRGLILWVFEGLREIEWAIFWLKAGGTGDFSIHPA